LECYTSTTLLCIKNITINVDMGTDGLVVVNAIETEVSDIHINVVSSQHLILLPMAWRCIIIIRRE